ncbi:hypothetical protein MSAN_02037000 [Mycena sanguinolenta]|uniref:Uncharacterized protein n=1 Tax=Mycena sanguinolenta TaxID=230812 RepID=A0A8H6XHW9_9AGAR|nr:hypothetical protein MSAN_02037000 [Mycena sanguinolenta]
MSHQSVENVTDRASQDRAGFRDGISDQRSQRRLARPPHGHTLGACLSAPEASADRGGDGMTHSVSERDKALHRQVEKAMKDAKAKMASEVKVLAASTFYIHTFLNLRARLRDLIVTRLKRDVETVEHVAEDMRDREPFPMRYFRPLTCLWKQDVVRTAWARGNEAVITENACSTQADDEDNHVRLNAGLLFSDHLFSMAWAGLIHKPPVTEVLEFII